MNPIRPLAPAVAGVLLAFTLPAAATPLTDRADAFRVLGEAARVERVFSNCRWIRGRPAPDLLARWRGDNRDMLDAAAAILSAQGGYTRERRAIVEGLAGNDAAAPSESRGACEAFQADVRAGRADLSVTLPMTVTRTVLGYRGPPGEPLGWRLEQRRGADGVLAHHAIRLEGPPDVPACDASDGAARGHVYLRGAAAAEGPDRDLWIAECLSSPVDPLTGLAPVRRDAGIPEPSEPAR